MPVLFFAIFTESGCSEEIISGISFMELNDLIFLCLVGSSKERRSSRNLMRDFSFSAGSFISNEMRNADSTSLLDISVRKKFFW